MYLGWLGALLVLINAIIINNLFNRSNFFDRITYIVAPCYVVFMSFFECSYSINGLLISHTIFALILSHIFEMSQNEEAKSGVFNVLILAGLGTTFVPSVALIIPFVFIMIRIVRPLSVRDVFIGIVSLLVPFFYFFSAKYMTGNIQPIDLLDFAYQSALKGDWPMILSVLFIFSIMGFFTFFNQWKRTSIRTKRQFQMLLVLFLAFLLLSLVYILSFQQIHFFSFLILPISLLLPFAFKSETIGMATSGVFYMLLAFSVMKFFIF